LAGVECRQDGDAINVASSVLSKAWYFFCKLARRKTAMLLFWQARSFWIVPTAKWGS
jgi:hypothetical protein